MTKWLNPVNWLATPAISLIKSYAIGKVKDAVSANKDEIIVWCDRIGVWIDRCKAVLSFLESLKNKLKDGNLDDDEAKLVVESVKLLAKEVTK